MEEVNVESAKNAVAQDTDDDLIEGPDGKFMSRAVYEAETGTACQID